MSTSLPGWKRILLKVSGEAFSGSSGRPVDAEGLGRLANSVAAAAALDVQIAIVNGGGNILRGAQADIPGLGRTTADTMGMLATVVNALSLQQVLESRDVPARVMTSVEMKTVAEPYIRRRAVRHMEKGRVVILAGGTGHPFFSTDTAAALRGVEIAADVLLKGTQVDGVYDRDPNVDPKAVRYERLTYEDVLAKRLRVMDRTAFTLCDENELPIVVFKMDGQNLARLLQGEPVGTIIGPDPEPSP